MKISLNWLSTHLDLSDLSISEISDALTFSGIEVEGIVQSGAPAGVVVAEIVEFSSHPNAEKLSVCSVNHGASEPAQIVCGAKNFKQGDKVPLARPGAVLPGNFEIKVGKLRGVESQGMMCSGRELQISDEHEGLLILDPALQPGTPLTEVFPGDVVFELEVTPNRPDCLSHLGVARDLAAVLGRKLISHPTVEFDGEVTVAKSSEILLSDPEVCPFYTARTIRGISVKESPEWLQQRLRAVGLRPINNIVDVTNFVLMETGQPLHAFDLTKLAGGIDVRPARLGEKLVTLDEAEQELQGDDLVIADSQKALAIAGVMGGLESGVTTQTCDILLESAWFSPSAIRRTSRRLGLVSDSSYRFERGVDPQQVTGASALATALILECAGGKADDALKTAGEPLALPPLVNLSHARVRHLLGAKDLSDDEMCQPLERLGLVKIEQDDKSSRWQPPSYRLDLEREVDLIEEIARIIGLDRIPSRNFAFFQDVSGDDAAYDFVLNIGKNLTAMGFYQAHSLKLTSERALANNLCGLTPGTAPELKNPLSEDYSHLRPGLTAGLLEAVERNVRQGNRNIRLFEHGTVFIAPPKGPLLEKQHVALVMTGEICPRDWATPRPGLIYFAHFRRALDELIRPNVAITPTTKPMDGLILSAEIRYGKQKVGICGQIHPSRARAMDLDQPVFIAELDLVKLQKIAESESVRAIELPRFPAMTRDIAMELPLSAAASQLEQFFESRSEPLLANFEMFDLFIDPTGTKLPADRKSIAYTLTYRHEDRTLKSAEVDDAHSRILGDLKRDLGVVIR